MAEDPTLNTTYLKFDAFSMKDAITQKLSEQGDFTDQIYPGSALSIIIDLVSLMFQNLVYNLNTTASESMFSDSQLYTNINRLVKLINYNPVGYRTATLAVELTSTRGPTGERPPDNIPPYARIRSGKKDSFGNDIYYSVVDDSTQAVTNAKGEAVNALLYNGRWRMYNTVFTSTGANFEKYILINLYTNEGAGSYIAWPYVHVYVRSAKTGKMTRFYQVDSLFSNAFTSQIHGGSYNGFQMRINEYFRYEIQFGDGIHCSKPEENDQIYILYLESNGPEGVLDAGDIDGLHFQLSETTLGVPSSIFELIYENYNTENLNLIRATNYVDSSIPVAAETVDSIRVNAPARFSTASRLITVNDIENWIKTNYASNILDAVAMNNAKYITQFYAWLYNIGMSVYGDGKKYINPNILSKHDLKYTDAADANAVYVWTKTYGGSEIQKAQLDNELEPYKPITSRFVFIPPLNVEFALCVSPVEYAKETYFSGGDFDRTRVAEENYLEVTVEESMIYSPVLIKNQIKSTIVSFFNENNYSLGGTVDIGELGNKLMAINGVLNLRTVFVGGEYENPVIKQGLSFVTWTSDVITPGDDIEISTMQRKMELFQFPRLNSAEIDGQIKIITSNTNITKIPQES